MLLETILFVLLSPGILLTLPPIGKVFWMTGKMSPMSVFVHAIVFGLLLLLLKRYTEGFQSPPPPNALNDQQLAQVGEGMNLILQRVGAFVQNEPGMRALLAASGLNISYVSRPLTPAQATILGRGVRDFFNRSNTTGVAGTIAIAKELQPVAARIASLLFENGSPPGMASPGMAPPGMAPPSVAPLGMAPGANSGPPPMPALTSPPQLAAQIPMA